jgi:hypothetical protein
VVKRLFAKEQDRSMQSHAAHLSYLTEEVVTVAVNSFSILALVSQAVAICRAHLMHMGMAVAPTDARSGPTDAVSQSAIVTLDNPQQDEVFV